MIQFKYNKIFKLRGDTMESNYKVAYNTEWSKLKKLEPLDIANRLSVDYNQENKQLTVPFFNDEYILDFT